MKTGKAQQSLLSAADPPPVRVTNRAGRSKFLLLGDHAGNCVPQALDGLGVAPEDLMRHIAIDSGVSALGQKLTGLLDATFVEQRYSRLVVDCNRAKNAPDSIAEVSDGTPVPANVELTAQAREQRYAEVFAPYHREIEQLLQTRQDDSQPTILVALHSFTPVLAGQLRPWDIGVLHEAGDVRFALAVLNELRAKGAWSVGDNEPYQLNAIDFTIPHHAYPSRLPYIELEVRADRLDSELNVATMAATLAAAMTRARELTAD